VKNTREESSVARKKRTSSPTKDVQTTKLRPTFHLRRARFSPSDLFAEVVCGTGVAHAKMTFIVS
jgi:hypothetical protein